MARPQLLMFGYAVDQEFVMFLHCGRLFVNWIHLLSYFFGGSFLANAIPHLVSGQMGRPFQSPFAKPPGEGLSSSRVNVLWGSFNVAVAYALLCHVGTFELRSLADAGVTAAGGLAISIMLAGHFGQLYGGNNPE
jgi:hypothetical protein